MTARRGCEALRTCWRCSVCDICATAVDGTADWSTIEAEFSTARSVNGLRKRWSKNCRRAGASSPESAPESAPDNSAGDSAASGSKVRAFTLLSELGRLSMLCTFCDIAYRHLHMELIMLRSTNVDLHTGRFFSKWSYAKVNTSLRSISLGS